jgi:hypothetical protein
MGVRDKIAKAIMGIKAYHSSPHDFDKFDLKKIGTGEGAQAYGHGLYFAESPAVSGQGGQYWKQFKNKFSGPEAEAISAFQQQAFDREKALAQLDRQLRGYIPGSQLHNELSEAKRLLESGPVGPRTYEVNIKADPAQMLDWDKPLRGQPQRSVFPDVAKEFSAKNPSAADMYHFLKNEGDQASSVSGVDFYRSLVDPRSRDAAHASAALSEAGIPGIKYLDEGSRAIQPAITDIERAIKQGGMYKGAGPDMWASRLDELKATPLTSNYVVFDPGVIDIMKKYGVVGAPAGALGMGALADQSQYEVQP